MVSVHPRIKSSNSSALIFAICKYLTIKIPDNYIPFIIQWNDRQEIQAK